MIIAGAGGAAHLPGMLASVTPLPVIGVPVPLAHLDGLDSLLSIVQMPAGIPVATVAVGGARNAGLLAVRILAAGDEALLRARVAALPGADCADEAGPRAPPCGRGAAGAASPAEAGARRSPYHQGRGSTRSWPRWATWSRRCRITPRRWARPACDCPPAAAREHGPGHLVVDWPGAGLPV